MRWTLKEPPNSKAGIKELAVSMENTGWMCVEIPHREQTAGGWQDNLEIIMFCKNLETGREKKRKLV